jgi:hypothetical protein
MTDRSSRYDFRNDPVLRAAGPLLRAAAEAYMGGDEFGAELFELWLSGKAPSEVIFDSPKWAAYMQADKGLSLQIDRHLTEFALNFRDEFLRRSPNAILVSPFQPYRTSFHAEVGSASGGYRTGYTQLHGSNQSVGDFQIEGAFRMGLIAGSKLEFTFSNNQMTFNDIVDPNFKWRSDVAFANVAKNIAAATGSTPPKNFTVRIRWREPGPWSYTVPAVQ